ncbi:MAG: Xaa-Pro peptidase family protein [Gemmatimonadota bacterium]|nr:Xaa-Pro peptidase family protein [Gemmatimonadota bacterium]
MLHRCKLHLPILLVLLVFSITLTARDPELYRARRQALMEKLEKPGSAFILVPGGVEKHLETFRQNNNFYYLTGIEQPDLLLVLSPEDRYPETLFLPARNLEKGSGSEAWVGEKMGPGEKTVEATGIARAVDRNLFHATLAGMASKTCRLYFDYTPSSLDGHLSAAEVLLDKIRRRYPHLEIIPLSRLIDPMRMVKEPAEISLLEKAVDITGQSLIETIAAVRPGMFEYEVEALIECGFRKRGSQRPGFPSIVGSGPNSTVLHYNSNQRRTEPGELLLMDVGAEYDYYTADITRTVPIDGKFSERQREVYDIVLRAQAAGIEAVRPGVTLADVHRAAREVIDKAGYGKYFIHYTSHFLGMDVHDVGSRDMLLKPGMVITVEPGIYISREALGVRIEDDVLVTGQGCRVLSSGILKRADEIEALMAGQ